MTRYSQILVRDLWRTFSAGMEQLSSSVSNRRHHETHVSGNPSQPFGDGTACLRRFGNALPRRSETSHRTELSDRAHRARDLSSVDGKRYWPRPSSHISNSRSVSYWSSLRLLDRNSVSTALVSIGRATLASDVMYWLCSSR